MLATISEQVTKSPVWVQAHTGFFFYHSDRHHAVPVLKQDCSLIDNPNYEKI